MELEDPRPDAPRTPLGAVIVRRARTRDAGPLAALARAVASEPEGWLIADRDWRNARQERRYLRQLRRSPHVAVLVAEAEAGIVGRLSVGRDPHPASAHVADVGLMVDANARRQGVGRALLDGAEAWAREAGVTKLELHVFPHNAAALALYESVGYRREGLRRRHFTRGRVYVDAVLMAKLLTP